MSSAVAQSEIVWRPDAATRERAQLTRFLSAAGLPDFEALRARAAEDPGWFTGRVLDFLGLRFDPPCRQVLETGSDWSRPHWCAGGGLNISQACLDRHLAEAGDMPAVIWEGEDGSTRQMTYAELHALMEDCAAGLRALGLGQGDAVGIHLPMLPETAAILLALARIGAVAVPLFSGYGPAAIAARLQDVDARALFTCDGFPRKGKTVAAQAAADEALRSCPSVETVIVLNRLGLVNPLRPGRDLTWDRFLEAGRRAGPGARIAEATGAEDPLLILYTSGTTGKPKGIVHSHCGFPVKGAQDMAFGTDVGPGSRITWITDLGWMMGPWLIYGSTLLGATMVLLDGAPDHPGPDRLWAFCARHGVEILGISPSLIRALAAQGDELPARHDLSRLRILASTGEPWNPASWNWLFEKVGRGRLPIINYSGGTEISGGILMGNPLLPLKACSFPAPCPGMDADVVDENGLPLRGQVGELVIRKPWIGMARGFWRDPQRYLETYWSRWPGLWVHGDFASVDADGHWFLHGRSDDTLKVAGKRVGPAEVESALVDGETVLEAAVIGVPDAAKGQALVAFCVPAGRAAPREEDLRSRVAAALGKGMSPSRVFCVSALPKTRNAKVMRRLIRAAFLGENPGDLTALENPAAVEALRRLGEAERAGARAGAETTPTREKP